EVPGAQCNSAWLGRDIEQARTRDGRGAPQVPQAKRRVFAGCDQTPSLGIDGNADDRALMSEQPSAPVASKQITQYLLDVRVGWVGRAPQGLDGLYGKQHAADRII